MRRTLLVLLLVTVPIAACGDDGDEVSTGDQPTTTAGTASTTTSPGDDAEPVGEPRTEGSESSDFPGEGPTAQLVDVRVAAHDGFDRVVFEFENRVPAYRLAYVEDPVMEQPSGREIEVEGERGLSITMSLASGVDLSGEEFTETYTGPDRIEAAGTTAITEVVQIEDFEATLSWVAGMDVEAPYAIAGFEDPPRLVLDIFHPAA